MKREGFVAPNAVTGLTLDFANPQAAKKACERYHYSRKIPPPPRVIIGVWEDDIFRGVVIFSRGASSNIGKPYNLMQDEICELTRVALAKHRTPVSRILKISIKMLKQHCPKLRLIVSYADRNEGHHGGIYQASNWLFTGESDAINKYVFNGKELHSRQVSPRGYNVQFGKRIKCPKPSECRVERQLGKFRYLFPLDDGMKRSIAHLRKEYPKRVNSVSVAQEASSLQEAVQV